jgi:hypothetical protein
VEQTEVRRTPLSSFAYDLIYVGMVYQQQRIGARAPYKQIKSPDQIEI